MLKYNLILLSEWSVRDGVSSHLLAKVTRRKPFPLLGTSGQND